MPCWTQTVWHTPRFERLPRLSYSGKTNIATDIQLDPLDVGNTFDPLGYV